MEPNALNGHAAQSYGPQLPDLLTTAEAARLVRLSVPTLERLRVTGDGPVFIKLGSGKRCRVVYRYSDLQTWLLAHRRDSTS
jgi:hypothetical protein